MKKISAPIAVSVFLIGSSWVAGQSDQSNVAAGKVVHEKHCVRCHGDQLDGRGPERDTLLVRPTNFLSVNSRSKTDWELLITIPNGPLFLSTHAYRDTLTGQEMLDVLSYIRSRAPLDTLS
jgi:hypothetical protein